MCEEHFNVAYLDDLYGRDKATFNYSTCCWVQFDLKQCITFYKLIIYFAKYKFIK